MSRYLQHPWVPPLVVVVTLGVVLALAEFTVPREQNVDAAVQTSRAPLGRATAVCLEPSLGRVAVATSPGGGGSGRAAIHTLGTTKGQRQVSSLRRRGTVWSKEMSAESSAIVVEADGSMAAGLEAEQVSNTGDGAGSGLSSTRCVRPDTDFWFVSDGAKLGRKSRLLLANVDDVPVSVNVDVYGPKGPQPSAAGRGITVGAHSRKVLELGALAPRSPIVALRLRTTSGRVAAGLHVRTSDSEKGVGIDWVPPTLAPRKELVVPGLPSGEGPRRLLLAAPGERSAEVQVRLVTGKGTYAPRGQDSIRVPAGSVKEVPLTEPLSGRAAAVRLSSDTPVTASVAMSVEDEVAYTAAAPALRGGAVVSYNGASSSVRSQLLLSAPVRAATVRITLLGRQGQVGRPRAVKIKPGRTATIGLSPDAVEGNFAVVVTPTTTSGPVYGARVLRQELTGQVSLTALPLRTSRTWVTVPDTDESLSAVIPRS